jgi:hypothetical protein
MLDLQRRHPRRRQVKLTLRVHLRAVVHSSMMRTLGMILRGRWIDYARLAFDVQLRLNEATVEHRAQRARDRAACELAAERDELRRKKDARSLVERREEYAARHVLPSSQRAPLQPMRLDAFMQVDADARFDAPVGDVDVFQGHESDNDQEMPAADGPYDDIDVDMSDVDDELRRPRNRFIDDEAAEGDEDDE